MKRQAERNENVIKSIVIDGALRILETDLDRVSSLKARHEKALEVCREAGAILDFATSDINIFLENASEETAKRVMTFFPSGEIAREKDPRLYCIF